MDIVSAAGLISQTVKRFDRLQTDQIANTARSIGNKIPSLHLGVAKRHAQTGDVVGFSQHLEAAKQAFAQAAPKEGFQPQQLKDIMAAISMAARHPGKVVEYLKPQI